MTSPCPPLIALLVLLCAFPVRGQKAAPTDPATPPVNPAVEGIRAAIEQAKSDAALDEAGKEAVAKRYGEAIAQFEAVSSFEQGAAAAKAEVEQGPAELASLRAELERRRAGTIPEAAKESADPPADAPQEMLDARLTSERTRVSELTRQVRDRESELTALEGRPTANRERIVAVTRLLAEAESAIAHRGDVVPATPQDRANFAYEHARLNALRAELAALEQEALAFDIRRELIQARRDLAASDLAYARERVARLESRSGALVTARIGEAERLIGELGLQAAMEEAEVRGLVENTRSLALGNQRLLGRIAAADAELSRATSDLDRLRRETENLRAQVGIGGLEDSFAEIALELGRTLPTPQSLRGEIEARRKEISAARLAAFREERDLDAAPSPEGQVEALLDRLRVKGLDEQALADLRPGLLEFLSNRTKLRHDSIDANRRLAALLGEIDLVASETLASAGELRDFLGERLVWVASSPPLGKNAFTGLRTSFLALVGPDALREIARAVARIDVQRWVLAGLLAFVLLAPRRRLRRFLVDSGHRTRRLSSDRIANTLFALAASLWLALPVPTLMAFFGWIFSTDPGARGTTYALGKGLAAPALLLLVLRFATVLCWREGVAEGHFRWKRSVLDPLRRGLLALVFLYLPAHFLLAVWWYNGGDLAAFQGPGRLVFIVAMVSLTLILRGFFRSLNGEGLASEGVARRFRRVWISVALLFPIALAVLAALGHFLTAVGLAYLMQKTGFAILGGVLLYGFLTRWAALKARRMALADALAQREAKRAAQEAADDAAGSGEGTAGTAGDETRVPTEEDEPVDWAVVSGQTRYLIRAVVTLLVLFGCWLAWSDALPALKYLDGRNLFGEVSFGDLIRFVAVVAIAGIVFQNLPGVLELGFLRALGFESGARNAIVTLCQYLVVAIAVALSFHVLGLDWSRFGWIAAALSVGIGFGLQEVVANFVSGLILLFERPIRVGDTVTVGGVDGVVTKIRIRATTITTGDKREFIVPNKEFITGKILNWTLSSPVTRLVIPVAVVQGTDVRKAREVLLGIAREQPSVLADPAPAAVFERFGAGTLELSLRCFVASPDQRLDTTHRINTLIHERFAAKGIELSSGAAKPA